MELIVISTLPDLDLCHHVGCLGPAFAVLEVLGNGVGEFFAFVGVVKAVELKRCLAFGVGNLLVKAGCAFIFGSCLELKARDILRLAIDGLHEVKAEGARGLLVLVVEQRRTILRCIIVVTVRNRNRNRDKIIRRRLANRYRHLNRIGLRPATTKIGGLRNHIVVRLADIVLGELNCPKGCGG